MTSEERHEQRYQRRKAKREEKRKRLYGRFDDFSRIYDMNSLYDAYRQSRKGIQWKMSTQKYTFNLLKNLCNTRDKLIMGEDVRKGFINFDLVERGKLRHISSVHFSERVVQRSLCDNALVPMLSKSLIYDNGASMKGKGIDFSLRRTEAFIHKYYRLYGNDGYVVSVDFSSYFENIQHKPLFELVEEQFTDKKLIKLIKDFIKAFGDKGLGIGSQVSQVLAISFMNKIDHYIKEKLREKFYNRYMDDSLFIVRTKDEAHQILETVRKLYEKFGIIVNEKKTHIVKLSHGFTFLKTKFYLTKTGKVVKRICRKSVTTMRRKLKKFRKFVDAGVMTFEQVRNSFNSWLGYASHKHTYHTRQNMCKLFNKLFIEDWHPAQYQPA
jgi:RNA-directed DNA polymerase